MSFGGVSFAFRQRHQSESGVTTLGDLRLTFHRRTLHCAGEETASFVRVVERTRDVCTEPAREQYLVPTTEPREIRFSLNGKPICNLMVALCVVQVRLRQCDKCFANLVSFGLVKLACSFQRQKSLVIVTQ